MFIERHGSGPRAFLGLHGWSGDRSTFAPLISGLPQDISFYALDLPGCGRSEPPAQWTLDAVADSIAEAARKIPAPFTLVGNCSGALLGLLAARQLHGRVYRMLLIDILAVYPWYFQFFLRPVIGPIAYYSAFANPLGRCIANASLSKHRAAETNLTRGFHAVDHAATYRYLKLFENYPAPETFSDLAIPIDIVYGEKTFRAIAGSVPRWQSVWPHARVWCLHGAGHLPILEATGRLQEILFKEGSISSECPTILR